MNPERPDLEFVGSQMMSDGESEASAIREKNFRQPKEAIELREPQLTPEGDRIPPTPEQVAEMDRRLMAVSSLMDESEMAWEIDGGLPVSVYHGEYLGYHKDLDISIDTSDVPELQHRAIENGYGMFVGELYRDQADEVQFAVRPADVQLFLNDRHHRFLIRTDHEGKIQTGGDLDFIDIHIRPKNQDGREFGTTSVPMPLEWNETTAKEFHGVTVRVPSLAKVAYFKLYANRPIDHGDLRAIARSEAFTTKQYSELEDMLRREREDKIASMQTTAEEFAAEWTTATTLHEAQQFFAEDAGNWTREYSVESMKAFGAMFYATAQQDIEMAKEQVIKAMMNTLPHEREDRLAEMKGIMESGREE